MRKDQANRWLYKIYAMLKDTCTKLRLNRKLGNYYGVTTLHAAGKIDAVIEIDPAKKEFMSTIVHECLHLVDWDLKEREVRALETEIMRHLTDRQLLNLLRRVVLFNQTNTREKGK